uniref:Secreted protein n=1 Tax=Caenorhabditis tropicalis TaxID=1561998 RepID=A0A1I7TIQ3_9PELO
MYTLWCGISYVLHLSADVVIYMDYCNCGLSGELAKNSTKASRCAKPVLRCYLDLLIGIVQRQSRSNSQSDLSVFGERINHHTHTKFAFIPEFLLFPNFGISKNS